MDKVSENIQVLVFKNIPYQQTVSEMIMQNFGN